MVTITKRPQTEEEKRLRDERAKKLIESEVVTPGGVDPTPKGAGSQPNIFTDPSGNVSGFTTKEGNTFLGDPKDISPVVSRLQSGGDLPLKRTVSTKNQQAGLESFNFQPSGFLNTPQIQEPGEPDQAKASFAAGLLNPPTSLIGTIANLFQGKIKSQEELSGEAARVGIAGAATGAGFGAPLLFNTLSQTALLGGTIQNVRAAGTFSNIRNLAEGLFFISAGLSFAGIDVFKERAPFVQQAYNTLGEEAMSIANDPLTSPDEKIRQIEFIEQRIIEDEIYIQESIIDNIRLSNTKEMLDLQTDLFEKKKEVLRAKNIARQQLVNQQYPIYNEEYVANWLSTASEDEIRKVEEKYLEQQERLLKISERRE